MRIKVSPTPGDRMDLEGAAVVAVRPHPAVLHGDLSAEVERRVLGWIGLNADALVDYWNGELDTVELGARLKRVGS